VHHGAKPGITVIRPAKNLHVAPVASQIGQIFGTEFNDGLVTATAWAATEADKVIFIGHVNQSVVFMYTSSAAASWRTISRGSG
jgi:hypothetical protein